MKIAIISDIHSNAFALEAVLNDIRSYEISKLIIAGDIFGYYPWACETFDLLRPFLVLSDSIKGNHDQMLLDEIPPDPVHVYWEIARQNAKDLQNNRPEAMIWLSTLDFQKHIHFENRVALLVHGTPDNPVTGRFYPDDLQHHDWMPGEKEIVILGHTHYPVIRKTTKDGLILNPGSVGQPRDGNPMPSWMILDTLDFSVEIIRTSYDQISTMNLLNTLGWDERAILALNKTVQGKM